MPAPRPARSTLDYIIGSALVAVLFTTTACGGAADPVAAPPSNAVTLEASAPALPSPTPSPEATEQTPLDDGSVPDAGGADLAGNQQPAYASKAIDVLASLPIKGRAPKTGYDRENFGQAWADVDRNGCDTRNDMLNRDLSAKTFKAGTRECVVMTGVLNDPYTGATIDFVRGDKTSSAVQIDHVVALSDAWQKGAQQLSADQRVAFANDPLNLLAVDGPSNQRKGAGDAATWLPPNKAYRCEYVALQISVKATYGLWVTQAEHDAMQGVLSGCAGIAAPSNATPPPAPVQKPVEEPAQPPAQAPVQQPAPAPPAPAVYYKNCAAVRAGGAAPIRVGDPGFSSKFDGDGDGVGCE